MIHCICIKFGTKFNNNGYVDKLFKGIKRNTSKDFLFTCFTDNTKGITNIHDIRTPPLPLDTGDWFSKIGLYNKELYMPDDQIFFFDLDTVIVGDLDEIFEYSGDFAIVRDFYRPQGLQSCFMSWRPAAVDFMYKNYRGEKCRHGDQGWCEQQYPTADIWQELYPEKIISYKVHVLHKPDHRKHTDLPGSLDTASIVCFHGKPMPHEVPQFWNMYD